MCCEGAYNRIHSDALVEILSGNSDCQIVIKAQLHGAESLGPDPPSRPGALHPTSSRAACAIPSAQLWPAPKSRRAPTNMATPSVRPPNARVQGLFRDTGLLQDVTSSSWPTSAGVGRLLKMDVVHVPDAGVGAGEPALPIRAHPPHRDWQAVDHFASRPRCGGAMVGATDFGPTTAPLGGSPSSSTSSRVQVRPPRCPLHPPHMRPPAA